MSGEHEERACPIAGACIGWWRPSAVPPLEMLTDDLPMVMDDAGSSRAAIFTSWECGILAMLLAATQPDRVAGLVLCDTFPFIAPDDTPTMPTPEEWGGNEMKGVPDRWRQYRVVNG